MAIVIYNDHGLIFFLDNLPTFAIGVAEDFRPADEGFGAPQPRVSQGAAELSWHLVGSLIDDEFDASVCREMKLDHACTTALHCSGICSRCRAWGSPAPTISR